MPSFPKTSDVIFSSIVFDMDGVLIDSERLTREAWITVGKDLHLAAIEKVFHQCIGISYESSRIIFREHYGPNVSYDYFRTLAENVYQTLVKHSIPLKPGAQEILEWLYSDGWKIGLASSTRRESVLRSLRRTDLFKFFSAIVCGDMVKFSKPEPEIYLTACAALNTDPSNCFAVEDSKNGIKSAYAAGMRTILIPDLIEPDNEMRRLASGVFPSLHDFHHWLQKKRDEHLAATASGIQH